MSRAIGTSLVLLGCLQLALLSWIAVAGSVGPRAGAPAMGAAVADSPVRPAADPDASTVETLSRLVEAIEARSERPLPLAVQTGGPTRQPVTPEWAAELQSTLGQLRHAIDRLAAIAPAAAPFEPAPAPDWNQLAQVRDGLIQDRDTQRKKLLLTPLRTVLHRFGKPTEVHLDKRGRQIWHYQRPQPGNPSATDDLFVAMNDGVVVSVFESW